jgi:hypothetical protein
LQACFDFISDDIIQSSVALAGGGSRATVGSCGVYSGGLMALSLRYNPRSDVLSETELKTLEAAREYTNAFRDWFISEFDSVVCRDVQQKMFGRYFNFMDDDDVKAFGDFPGKEKCNDIVKKAARKVAELLTQVSQP